MNSFSFPNIFSGGKTNLVYDKEAAKSNLKLALGATKMSLLGDPYFGTNLKKYLYEQADTVLADIIIDEIYSAIQVFVPQIITQRKDIKIIIDGTNVLAQVTYIYLNDIIPDMFIISLTEE